MKLHNPDHFHLTKKLIHQRFELLKINLNWLIYYLLKNKWQCEQLKRKLSNEPKPNKFVLFLDYGIRKYLTIKKKIINLPFEKTYFIE